MLKRQNYSNRLPENESRFTEKGHKGIYWGDKNVLYHECGDSYMIQYICLNSSNCTLKMVMFYWCKLYVNTADFKNNVQYLLLPSHTATLDSCLDNWIHHSVESPTVKNPEGSSLLQSSQMDLYKHKSNLIIPLFKSPQQLLVSLKRKPTHFYSF